MIIIPLIVYSQGNYKKMGGSPDGSKAKVKMDPSATWVVTGKHENMENGTDAQIYLVNLSKTLLAALKNPDFTKVHNFLIFNFFPKLTVLVYIRVKYILHPYSLSLVLVWSL